MKKLLLAVLIFLNGLTYADPDPSLKFIENKRQWPSSIHYLANIQGGSMTIHPTKFKYYFLDYAKVEEIHHQSHQVNVELADESRQDQIINGQAIDVSFINANPHALPCPFGKSSEYYNYFLGADSTKWASKAFAYDGILYQSVYKGIDLKVYSSGKHGKYDWIVSPEADPGQINVRYEGQDELVLDNGNLYVKIALGEFIERRPYAYQFIDEKKREVRCEYQLDVNLISFVFPDGYDPCYELIIDPLLIFSTYSGSDADNWGSTATPGERGNLYSSGVTNHWVGTNLSGIFPATAGAFQTTYGGIYDVAILKYDSAGKQMLYASYLGGSASESPHSLVMADNEDLIVLGTTSSTNFPTSPNAFDRSFNSGTLINHVVEYGNGSDIFISRISKDGSQLLASTYLGGTANDGLNDNLSQLRRNYGDQLRGDVITDTQGNVYISSVTASSDFPAVNSQLNIYRGGESDAILVKLVPDLSAISWSMFLGGDRADASHTLKLDDENNIFLAGGTASADFPVTAGFQSAFQGVVDGWVAKISSDGSGILNATFTGTSAFDQVYFLDIDPQENVYVYGQTSGSFLIYPSTSAVYNVPNSGQFIQKFNNTLSSVIFSTVFGTGKGSPDISPTAFIVNDCNNLYMAGWGGTLNNSDGRGWSTSTKGMTTTLNALQRTSDKGNDFYFLVLTADASQLLYATFLGGSVSRTHVDGGTSRFDKSGIVYHAVCSGCRVSPTAPSTSDFPTTPGAWSRTNESANCNNAAFKFDLSSLRAIIQTNSISFGNPGLKQVCIPDKIVFQNFSTGGVFYEWDFGDGTAITKTDTAAIAHEYKQTGTYTVKLRAIDKGTCLGKDSTYTIVYVNNAEATIQDDDNICEESTYTLKASGGAKYAWRSNDNTFQSNQAQPVISPSDTTQYHITVTEANGCIHEDSVTINVIPTIKPEFKAERNADCFSTPAVLVENTTDSLRVGDRLYFDFGDGVSVDADEVLHEFKADGQYSVKLVGVREFCVTEKVIPMSFFKLKIPNVITPGIKDGANDVFSIQYGVTPNATPADYGHKVSLTIYNRWGNVVYEANDYKYDWSGSNLAAGVYYYEVTVEGHATCKGWVQLIK